MQLKTKKRALIMLISLALATTSCGKSEDIKPSYQEYLEEYLDEYNHYESTSKYDVNKSDFKTFYQTFFTALLNNVGDEDYKELYSDIAINDYNMEVILKDIYNQIPTSEDTFGRGFFHMFSEQLREEVTSPYRFLRDEVYSNINTLRTLINNDEEFYNAVFSYDIDNIITCIIDNTGYQNRNLIEELILNMDSYVNVTRLGDSMTYQDEVLASNYKTRIREIMVTLINYKCMSDDEFTNSFYGRMLKMSNYYDGNINIYQELFGVRACLVDQSNENMPYSIRISYADLYGNASLEELKEKYLENKIWDTYAQDYTRGKLDFDNIYMELLVTLLDNSALNDADRYGNSVRSLMYDNLSSFFTSEDEFNSFVLSLSENTSAAQNYFFFLFLKTLNKDEITYEDFVRYMSLANYITSHTITHVDDLYVEAPNGDLVNMPKDEYINFISPYYESFIFENGEVDYLGYLEKMREVLKNNNLGYSMTYNPNCYISWEYGRLYPASGSTIVVSEKYEPQQMKYNGTNIIYYEVPDAYVDGWGVEDFINYEAEYTLRRVDGIKETIIDPNTNEAKTILIVGINTDISDYEPISFATYYYYFAKNLESKNLTLEADTHE